MVRSSRRICHSNSLMTPPYRCPLRLLLLNIVSNIFWQESRMSTSRHRFRGVRGELWRSMQQVNILLQALRTPAEFWCHFTSHINEKTFFLYILTKPGYSSPTQSEAAILLPGLVFNWKLGIFCLLYTFCLEANGPWCKICNRALQGTSSFLILLSS